MMLSAMSIESKYSVALRRMTLGLIISLSVIGGARADAIATATQLGSGVNILGYDGIWNGGVDAPFKQRYFRMIRDAGFQHVRINLHAFRYMDATNVVSPFVMDRLEWVVQQATSHNLTPIIDEHDYHFCQRDPVGCRSKLIAFWKQMAQHYSGKYPTLIFELLNEPGGAMTVAAWNALARDLLETIRTRDRNRTVIVAAMNTEDPGEIDRLDLPASDRNIIVTFHYYKPFRFTHQGAPWNKSVSGLRNVSWGTEVEKQELRADFDRIDVSAKLQGRPVYLGEFGVLETADIVSRTTYLGYIAQEAKRRGWSWAYWQFDHDFAVFDSSREQWVYPILRALMPIGNAQPP
jgi:endoglucanase